MLRRLLSTRDGRTVAWGVVVIAVIVVAGRGVPAWRTWVTMTHARARLEARELAQAESLLSAAPAISDSLIARSRHLSALESTLLSGDTPTAAAAQLAALISASATGSNVELGPLDIHADSAQPSHLTTVRVRVAATGDIEGLTRFVGLIEAAPIRCAVQSFAVSQSDPLGSVSQAEVLHTDLVVSGLYGDVAQGVTR